MSTTDEFDNIKRIVAEMKRLDESRVINSVLSKATLEHLDKAVDEAEAACRAQKEDAE